MSLSDSGVDSRERFVDELHLLTREGWRGIEFGNIEALYAHPKRAFGGHTRLILPLCAHNRIRRHADSFPIRQVESVFVVAGIMEALTLEDLEADALVYLSKVGEFYSLSRWHSIYARGRRVRFLTAIRF